MLNGLGSNAVPLSAHFGAGAAVPVPDLSLFETPAPAVLTLPGQDGVLVVAHAANIQPQISGGPAVRPYPVYQVMCVDGETLEDMTARHLVVHTHTLLSDATKLCTRLNDASKATYHQDSRDGTLDHVTGWVSAPVLTRATDVSPRAHDRFAPVQA